MERAAEPGRGNWSGSELPMQFQIGAHYYTAEKPDNGPEWGLRFALTFLFPK